MTIPTENGRKRVFPISLFVMHAHTPQVSSSACFRSVRYAASADEFMVRAEPWSSRFLTPAHPPPQAWCISSRVCHS